MSFNSLMLKRVEESNETLYRDLLLVLPDFSEIDKLTIVNVGTPKVDYDAVGPITGSLLETMLRFNPELQEFVNIIGTMDDPAHALTIEGKVNELYIANRNINNFILAIDATVTADEPVLFKPHLRNKGIKPGAAVGKNIPEVGTLSIAVPTLYKPDVQTSSNINNCNYRCNYNESAYMAKKVANVVYSVLDKKLELFYRDIEEECSYV